jgi:putative tricarboxylic transport membrane protein
MSTPFDGEPRLPLWKVAAGPAFFLAFGLVGYLYAHLNIGPTPPGQLGPALWPKVCLLGIAVASGFKLAEVLWQHRSRRPRAGTAALKDMDNRKLSLMIAMIILVVPAIGFLGFPAASVLFFWLFMRLAGERKGVRLALVSVLGTIALLYLFVKVVYIPLPRGEWLFDDLTLFIYRALWIQ